MDMDMVVTATDTAMVTVTDTDTPGHEPGVTLVRSRTAGLAMDMAMDTDMLVTIGNVALLYFATPLPHLGLDNAFAYSLLL